LWTQHVVSIDHLPFELAASPHSRDLQLRHEIMMNERRKVHQARAVP